MTSAAILQQQSAGRSPAVHRWTAGDPWQFWSAEQIATILNAPVENVRTQWPLVYAELAALGMDDRPVLIAALATIGVEAGTFLPVKESWWLTEDVRRAYLERMYGYLTDTGRKLGNILPGDGWRYGGAGLVQLSGRGNYRTYGEAIGIDLEAHPDRAIEPAVSAKTLAVYFDRHRTTSGRGIADAARDGDWVLTRVLVNGGLNGWNDYWSYISRLSAA